MNKRILLCAALIAGGTVNAQIFSDDFESLNAGDYIGPSSTYWTTWSGTEGGNEDVQITTAQANSGTNSIYFSSTGANGGPQDVVLEFGQQFTDGIVIYESALYVVSGKNAYFNLQGSQTIGQTWAMNFNADGGNWSIDDGLTADLATGTYPVATWFTLRIEANLTLGTWEAFIDGVSAGSWSNGVNTLASVDLYPINNSGFYVDDVMFDYQTFTLPTLNASVSNLAMNGNIATQVVDPVVTVLNAGQNDITSFDLTLNYNGVDYTENITGITLTSLNSYEVSFTGVSLVAGANDVTVTVSNVNGGSDDDNTDDQLVQSINPVVPAPGKVVVGEEGTGTWCGWCPRGTVFMDRYENQFGDFWAGIAVHNGDPMANATYDAGMGALISGYPSSVVDRGTDVDPSAMSNDFFSRLQVAPTALISTEEMYDEATNTLTVTVSADFQANATSSYKLACVITEDHVTGTAGGYAQANYYAGGGNGDLIADDGTNWATLPSTVPAGQMEYNHVARGIQPSFAGDASSFPATVNTGEVHSRTYTFTIDPSWDLANMHVIGMLIAPNGRVDNASKKVMPEFVGLEEIESEGSFTIFPNPATTNATIGLDVKETADVQVALVDMSGKVLRSRDYGVISGYSTIDLNTSTMDAGVYMIQVTMNGKTSVQRLVIQ